MKTVLVEHSRSASLISVPVMFRVIARSAGVLLTWMLLATSNDAQAPPAAAAQPPVSQSASETAAATLSAGGKHREALDELNRAWAEYRKSGDQLALARVALKRVSAHRALGEIDAATRLAEQARQLAAGDPSLIVSALTVLSLIANDRGDFTSANRHLQEALPIAEQSADTTAQLNVLRALARLADARGLQQEAADHWRRAIGVADKSGNAALRVEMRVGMSVTLLGLSRYDDALAIAQEAHELAQREKAPMIRANGLFQLAQANNHVWNLDRAATLWPAVIDAYRAAGNSRGVAAAQMQSVFTSYALDDFDRAAAEGEAAVGLLRQAGLVAYVAEMEARVALSEVRRGRRDRAVEWTRRAREELATTPEARHLFVHNDLGLVAIDLGEFAQARSDFSRVMEVARRVGNIEYQWRAGWGRGRTDVAAGTPAGAIPHLEETIKTIELLRQTIPAASERAAFMTQRVGPYETLVEALVDRATTPDDPWAGQAFEVAERARSRALADLLAEARARLSDPRLTTTRDSEIAFGRRFTEIQKRIAAATDAPARAAALAELQNAEQEYEALVLRVRRESPAYAALVYPRALSAAEIAATLAPDEALIEFLITPKRGFGFAVTRDRLQAFQVPGRDRLEPQMRLLQAVLATNDDTAIRRLGTHFYEQLLAPAATALHAARRIVVVPDGVLQRLPFALLRHGDRWLIETHAISQAPSATILVHLRQADRPRPTEPLLAFAAPDGASASALAAIATPELASRPLTHAAQEVRDARRIVGAGAEHTLVGQAATEGVLKTVDASRYRILHFAAHAVVDEIAPRRSAVLLAPGGQEDGLLQVNEIANLSLNADLVVLAACQSQIGRVVRGEGLLSLSRAFIRGGARAVLATLWPVEDRATSQLMQAFYKALRAGRTPDDALRAAQLQAIAAGGSQAAPVNWAAFLVTGETSAPILDGAGPTSPWPLAVAIAALLAAIALGVRIGFKRRTRIEPVALS